MKREDVEFGEGDSTGKGGASAMAAIFVCFVLLSVLAVLGIIMLRNKVVEQNAARSRAEHAFTFVYAASDTMKTITFASLKPTAAEAAGLPDVIRVIGYTCYQQEDTMGGEQAFTCTRKK